MLFVTQYINYVVVSLFNCGCHFISNMVYIWMEMDVLIVEWICVCMDIDLVCYLLVYPFMVIIQVSKGISRCSYNLQLEFHVVVE